jgi:hypothetical protein
MSIGNYDIFQLTRLLSIKTEGAKVSVECAARAGYEGGSFIALGLSNGLLLFRYKKEGVQIFKKYMWTTVSFD